MGSFTMNMPEKGDMTGGANYLKVPGTYHLQVVDVDEQPTDKDDKAVDGFKVDFAVLGGPEAGKKIDVMFFNSRKAPEAGKKDWPALKQAAFFIASGLTDFSTCGKQISIELQDAVNRQVIAEFSFDERDKDKPANQKFLQLHFANIYHIDDPRVASAAKDSKSLALIPAKHRRKADDFKVADSNGAPPASQPAADDDLGDV